MNERPSHPILSRRDLLKLLVAAGAIAAVGDALFEYAPWLDYDQEAIRARRPLEKNLARSAQMRELVRYATLAASGHNAQPWKFAIREDAIEIHPDFTRRLPVVDPQDRELWISLGCALENLLVAARAAGYAPEVTYPRAMDFIHVRLTAGTSHGSSSFDAIPLRQNTRSEYDGLPVQSDVLDQVLALPLEPGIVLRPVMKRELETVLEYVQQANVVQYADPAFLAELNRWLRFNKKEALASDDGLYLRCLGKPELPGWLGRNLVTWSKPRQQADADARNLRSSSGALVIAAQGESRSSWVQTGQVYERVALQLTALNIKSAFLNQPIEVVEVRRQFQAAMGLGGTAVELLMRFGHADPMPRSMRRPVEEVLLSS